MFRRLRELGLLRVFLGVESATPEGLASIGRRQTVAEAHHALEVCEELGITIGPIASLRDVAENVHCRERGSTVEVDDPATGRRLRIPNVPFRLLGTPGRIRFPGLPLGAANDVIYRDLLGYPPERIRGMRERGTI